MRRLPLHIQQPTCSAGSSEQIHQPYQRDLRCVPPDSRSIEHRLTGKQARDAHAVKAAGQLTAERPGFHRMHHAALEEPPIDPANVAVDPSAGPTAISAAVQYIV